MSLFFDSTTLDLSDEEAEEFERQAGIRLLEFLKGVANKAINTLPSEWRDWANFPELAAPDWCDPTYPHLAQNEILRVFGNAPKAIPSWIELSPEQREAAEILLQISKAAHLLRGIEPEKALRLLDAGITVGHEITKAHVAPWEPIAEAGEKVKRGGKTGNIKAYGTAEQKQKRWDSYRAAVIAKMESSPRLSLSEARRRVAKQLGVSYNTICKHSKM